MARRFQEQELKQTLNGQQQEEVPEEAAKYTDVINLKSVEFDKHFGAVYSIQYNYDGSVVAVGFSGGAIRMYNPKTGAVIRDLRSHRYGGFPIMCMRFHPKNPELLFVGTAEGHVYAIDTATGEGAMKPVITEDTNEINTLDFNLDCFYLCTCGKDLTVRVYDSRTLKLNKTYEGYKKNMTKEDLEAGNTMRVFSLKFSPEKEDIFLTAGWDNHIKIWDLRTNDGIKRQIHGPHVCGDALDMKGHTILSGSWCANHALQEWDYGEGKLIRDIKFPHKDGAFLYCAQYANSNTVLAGGSGTHSAEVIDRDSNKHIGSVQMTGPVQALDCAEEGKLFAVGGSDNVVKLCAMK